ncbi:MULTISPECIES: hypothetical protein [Pontibacillus]|uniref:Uncharacterized protein n=1 Tax=Pontibacillus chungwhensis TaxID=265426 RepID=A0ABY8UZI3_9BACI|nr:MULTISPECIES: hypothetical protein [Pontibacillus]WIF97794.1 hypothetical protein QNI29_19030 [Pontibacillus chungwhensis]
MTQLYVFHLKVMYFHTSALAGLQAPLTVDQVDQFGNDQQSNALFKFMIN